MGATTFPSGLYARISPEGYENEPTFDVTIQGSRDKSELRLYNGESRRISFTLVTRDASERATLTAYWASRHGSYDSFDFISRDDLTTYHVRFDEFSGHKTGPTTWEYAISLVGSAS
jgi:hypothetical protein